MFGGLSGSAQVLLGARIQLLGFEVTDGADLRGEVEKFLDPKHERGGYLRGAAVVSCEFLAQPVLGFMQLFCEVDCIGAGSNPLHLAGHGFC